MVNKVLLDPIERQSATEAVAGSLIKLLNDGALLPGDRLPSERELATQLQVGRTTVREALKLLTLSGLLEAKRGSGTFVREDYSSFIANQVKWLTLLSAQDVDQLLEVREALELQTVKLATQRATDEEIKKIESFRKWPELKKRDAESDAENDFKFHLAIAVASHNQLLVELILSLRNLLRDYVILANELAEDMESTFQEHERVFQAILSRKPDVAAVAMSRHLAISRSWVEKTLAKREDPK